MLESLEFCIWLRSMCICPSLVLRCCGLAKAPTEQLAFTSMHSVHPASLLSVLAWQTLACLLRPIERQASTPSALVAFHRLPGFIKVCCALQDCPVQNCAVKHAAAHYTCIMNTLPFQLFQGRCCVCTLIARHKNVLIYVFQDVPVV